MTWCAIVVVWAYRTNAVEKGPFISHVSSHFRHANLTDKRTTFIIDQTHPRIRVRVLNLAGFDPRTSQFTGLVYEDFIKNRKKSLLDWGVTKKILSTSAALLRFFFLKFHVPVTLFFVYLGVLFIELSRIKIILKN